MGEQKVRKKSSESEQSYEGDSQSLSRESQLVLELMEVKMREVSEEMNRKLAEKAKVIEQLKNEVTALRKDVVALEDRLEEAEAYERRDTIVLSGTELPAATDGENTANTVCSLMKDKVEIVIKKILT